MNGKTALITGASSGIGRELTRLFAKDGYNLVLVGRNEDMLQQQAYNLYNQYGTQATILIKDLADPSAPDQIYAETNARDIQIDVLVNDAGFGEYGQFATETDLQREREVVQVNAIALMHLTKLYLNDMVGRNEGKILMLGSEVSVIPNPMMAVYGATKAFIKSFAEAIRNELKDTNVIVTVLMPGATNTGFFRTAGAADARGADPNKTADPSAVAREGYEALMANKDHVVAGWMNKVRVAASYLLPDPLLAAGVRRDMTPSEEAKHQQRQTMVVAIGVAAVVLGGLWVLSRSQSSGWPRVGFDPASYRRKANRASQSAQQTLAAVGDSVKEVYNKATTTAEEVLG